MTTEEIAARVEAIRAMADDPEAAHAAEDKLRADFIRDIAEHQGWENHQLSAQARLVISTDEIEFPRWTA